MFRLVVLSLLRSRQVPDGLRCSASYVTQRCLRRRPTGYRQTITAFVDDHRHTLYVTLFFQPRYTLTLMMKRSPAASNNTARQCDASYANSLNNSMMSSCFWLQVFLYCTPIEPFQPQGHCHPNTCKRRLQKHHLPIPSMQDRSCN